MPAINLPEHVALSIEHNDHKLVYQSVRQWAAHKDAMDMGIDWVTEADREQAFESDDVWVARWYPDTPVGFVEVAAATLENLLGYMAGA